MQTSSIFIQKKIVNIDLTLLLQHRLLTQVVFGQRLVAGHQHFFLAVQLLHLKFEKVL